MSFDELGRTAKFYRYACWALLSSGFAAGLLAISACSHERRIGACGTYVDTPGKALIIEIVKAPANENNCSNDPVQVLFNFTPNNPTQSALAATGVHFTVAAGANPPRAWVTSSGLTVGSEHRAVRSDQSVGSCTPIVYSFTDVDANAATQACYQ